MKRKIFVIVCLCVLTAVYNLFAIDYYVSPAGDDNNPGIDSLPFKTIQKAADAAMGGDNVNIMPGLYNEIITIKNSSADLMRFRSYGGIVTLDGTGYDVFWSGIIQIVGQKNILIEGLKLVNSNGTGIWCDSSQNITISNNSTFNTASSGIGAWHSKNVTIYRNKIDNACSNMSQECISVAGCDTFITEFNTVTNCYKEGICSKDGSNNGIVQNNSVSEVINKLGIYVDAWDKHTYNIKVRNNIVHNCNSGVVLASEMGGLLENVWVYNNLLYDNKFLGIDVSYNGDDTTVKIHPIKDVYIINNTVVKNGYSWGGGIANSNRDASNITVRNNICYLNLSFQIAHEGINPSNMTIDHNLIWYFLEYPDEERGTDFIEAEPMFVDTALKNYHLLSNSPAINAGSSSDAPSDDIEGNVRPLTGGYDIGAFEYNPFGDTGNESDDIILEILPNPFSDFCTIKTEDLADIEIYDSFGRSIAKAKGQLIWKPDGYFMDGVYFVRFQSNNKIQTKPIILLR